MYVHIDETHFSLPCVVSIVRWFSFPLNWMGWLVVGMVLMGVFKQLLVVFYRLLGIVEGIVIIVSRLPYGSVFKAYVCLVSGVIIL